MQVDRLPVVLSTWAPAQRVTAERVGRRDAGEDRERGGDVGVASSSSIPSRSSAVSRKARAWVPRTFACERSQGWVRPEERGLTAYADAQPAHTHGDVDITFTPSGTDGYDDLARAAQLRIVHGVEIRLAAPEDIIRSKGAAARAKDFDELPSYDASPPNEPATDRR